jgi:hypothetical protein
MSRIVAPTLERVVVCEHCRGAGAEIGWLGDRHVDMIECIEALRDQISMLQDRVAELEQRQDVPVQQAA